MTIETLSKLCQEAQRKGLEGVAIPDTLLPQVIDAGLTQLGRRSPNEDIITITRTDAYENYYIWHSSSDSCKDDWLYYAGTNHEEHY